MQRLQVTSAFGPYSDPPTASTTPALPSGGPHKIPPPVNPPHPDDLTSLSLLMLLRHPDFKQLNGNTNGGAAPPPPASYAAQDAPPLPPPLPLQQQQRYGSYGTLPSCGQAAARPPVHPAAHQGSTWAWRPPPVAQQPQLQPQLFAANPPAAVSFGGQPPLPPSLPGSVGQGLDGYGKDVVTSAASTLGALRAGHAIPANRPQPARGGGSSGHGGGSNLPEASRSAVENVAAIALPPIFRERLERLQAAGQAAKGQELQRQEQQPQQQQAASKWNATTSSAGGFTVPLKAQQQQQQQQRGSSWPVLAAAVAALDAADGSGAAKEIAGAGPPSSRAPARKSVAASAAKRARDGFSSSGEDSDSDFEPSEGDLSLLKGLAAARRDSPGDAASKKRKKNNPWSTEETVALVDGAKQTGIGKWAEIKRLPGIKEVLASRTAVDLKDKWRNLARVAPLPRKVLRDRLLRTGSDVPIEVFLTVKELMDANDNE